MRLAYQGEPGAYSEAAALQFGGAHAETLPCVSFDQVFEAVVKKRAHLITLGLAKRKAPVTIVISTWAC